LRDKYGDKINLIKTRTMFEIQAVRKGQAGISEPSLLCKRS